MLLKAVIASLIVKCFVGFFGYSGQGKPPMFGDYEAQRHWMEITYNLPISDWYFDTDENNLTYWGLDYPPLTAYHSWILGAVAHKINPDFVRLNASRGYESVEHKFFMRSTVILSDLVTYTASILLFVKYALHKLYTKSASSRRNPNQAVLYIALLYPGLILIDNGHFQYNCVSLGFVVLSVVALMNDRDVTASILYCLSFSYKQMSLYYSFPYFVYYLGKFIKDSDKSLTLAIKNIIKIAFTVILTIAVAWSAFLPTPQLFQVLHRVFPFSRGIFEDKVANFWCVANVFYKLKAVENDRMALFCTIVVILGTLVSCMDLLLNPQKDKFLLSLVNASLTFFLFSFQVHEKSILLVAVPILLNFVTKPVHCTWFLMISVFSMWPLLYKDGLVIPFYLLILSYILIVNYFYPIFNRRTLIKELTDSKLKIFDIYYYFYLISLCVCLALSLASLLIPPPPRYPDIFPLLISVYSAMHFLFFLFYFNYIQVTLKSKRPFLKRKKHS